MRYVSCPLDKFNGKEPVRVGAVCLLLYAGCRKRDVLSLRGSDVTGRLMTLDDSKTAPRRVNLGLAAQEALPYCADATRQPVGIP